MIKIYGEAKTGTTYLEHLIKANCELEVAESSDWGEFGWKHGFPNSGADITIFLLRDVYEWVKSMQADTIDKRFRGLESKFGNTENKFESMWKNWDDLIQCRTAKYHSYIGFWSLHKNSWLLNYRTLRMNPKVLETILGIEVTKYIHSHTYIDTEGKDNPNRKELTVKERAFIDSRIDPELERFVNELIVK